MELPINTHFSTIQYKGTELLRMVLQKGESKDLPYEMDFETRFGMERYIVHKLNFDTTADGYMRISFDLKK